jgi:hypothetical protein
MPSPIRISVGTRASVVWSGRPAQGISTLLLMNTDLNNTVCIGSEPNTMFNGDNTIPILPNGSLSVDPASAWWVVGAVTGSAPLVMVPNGQSNFLGITQGLGQLVIPSIRSPNFLAGVSGWQIAKDGSAEFNDLTIRGVFKGNNFVINSLGEFFYSGTPAFGNLILANVPDFVTDDGHGNQVPFPGTNIYNTSNNTLTVINGGSTDYFTFATEAGPFIPSANMSYVSSTGTLLLQALAANLVEISPAVMLPSGPTPSSSAGNSVLYSNPNGQLNVIDGLDQTSYATERRSLVFNSSQTSSTTFTTVTGLSSAVSTGRTYRFEAQVCWIADQSAGQVAFRFNGPTTVAPTLASFVTLSLGVSFTPTPVGLAGTSNPGLTMTGGQAYVTKISGTITTTANGTFSIQIANVTAGDTFHIVAATFLDLMPV